MKILASIAVLILLPTVTCLSSWRINQEGRLLGPPPVVTNSVLFNTSNADAVIQWTAYSGPGTVVFGNPAQTNTTANFNAPGIYTLELSANDGVHAVAYDAAVITVTNAVSLFVARSGTNLNFTWTGGSPPFVLQQADALPAVSWNNIVTTSIQGVNLPITNTTGFFRARGQ